jgi:hypothetical protein
MSTVCPVILPILPVGVPVPIVDRPRTDFLWQRNPFLLEGKAQIVAPLWDAAPNLASNTLAKGFGGKYRLMDYLTKQYIFVVQRKEAQAEQKWKAKIEELGGGKLDN